MKQRTENSRNKKLKSKNEKSDTPEVIYTKMRTQPSINAASSVSSLFTNPSLKLSTLVDSFDEQIEKINNGDTSILETMLISQAQTLQMLFHFSVERVANGEIVNNAQVYGDLAIKANNACRKTLNTLNQMKNPSTTTFIKQQNHAQNQQINVGDSVISKELKSKNSKEKSTNELLNNIKDDNAILDQRGPSETSKINSSMAAVEII